MRKYFLKKIIQVIAMLFCISVLAFAIIYFAPGDISSMYITPDMTKEEIAKVKADLGLDKSLSQQYLSWLKEAVKGDLGVSLASHSSVAGQIASRLPATIKLMGASLLIAVILAIPLGLCAGYWKNTWIEHVISSVAYLGISVPGFWLGMLLIIFFSMKLHIFPSSGMHTVGNVSIMDTLWHMVLPCVTLSIPTMAVYIRYIKANTIGELGEEYVLTARAKGTSGVRLLGRHVLKNILLPVITLLGMNMASLVCGSFIVESIFGWPGVGSLAMTAIKTRDYPVIMAYIMLTGIFVIMGNFLADILYGIVDPRIKGEFKKAHGK